jgi:uncharacterized membrane protein
VFFKGLVTVLAVDAVIVLISIPLILRKVPRNVVYGFRTRATLGDDLVWYEANAYFGRRLVVSSLICAAVVLVLYDMNGVSGRFFFAATIAALVVPSLVTTLLTFRYVRTLTPGGGSNTYAANAPR